MRFRVGRRMLIAGPGDVVKVAPGVAHSFANAGEQEARLHVEVRPALRMEEMFAEVIAMANAGRLTRRGMPRNMLDLARLARRYDQVAHAPRLTVGMQRVLLAPLLLAARYPRAGRPRRWPPRLGSARSREALSYSWTFADGIAHLSYGRSR